MKRTLSVTSTEVIELEFDDDALKEALCLPFDAEIYFHVPGGADWSNTDLDIDPNHPLRVRITVTKLSHKES